ncbi:MAG: methyltransferase, partial [bacterium]|nr:methyltransferase [bacterium]
MQTLLLTCPAAETELLIAELWERGTSGVIEGEELGGAVELQAFFDEEFATEAFADYSPRWQVAEERNWVREIMEGWDPLEVGERFFVVPDWRDDPTPPGRLRLDVHPGIALGTGYHATTQMCLEAMERHLRPGGCFFDLGAGSGILSHAAHLLGAGRILGCDIDPQATASAARNLRRANVSAQVYTGSTRSIVDGSIDLLAANISAAT